METHGHYEIQDIKPELRATSIFQDFNDLSIGEEMILNIDHEPMDLYQQFEEKYHGQFTWSYLDNGPDLWFISIIKSGNDVTTVSDILTEHPCGYAVLRKHNIDVCFKGNNLFSDACKEAGVTVKQIISEIEEAENNSETNIRISEWPLDFLTEYITMNHHIFIKEKTKQIFNILRDLQNEEETIHPVIFNINYIFINVQDALKKHIFDEEQVIFPVIKELVQNGQLPKNLPYDSLRETISHLRGENNVVCSELAHIRKTTQNLINEEKTRGKLKVLFAALEEFEKDLHYHLHLENNILFPKAVFLEDEADIWND